MYGDKIFLRNKGESWSDTIELFSNRDYAAYEVMAARCEVGYGGTLTRDQAVNLRIFIDATTGVVVADIEEYEKSLGLEPEERQGYY